MPLCFLKAVQALGCSGCCPETVSLGPFEGSANCSTADQVSRSTQLVCFTCRSIQLLVGRSDTHTHRGGGEAGCEQCDPAANNLHLS